VIELVRWEEWESADRIGLDDQTHLILDVSVPLLRVPGEPRPQRELAGRGWRRAIACCSSGVTTPRSEFQERLDQALADAQTRRFRDDVE